jgi:hypothetical protein
VLEVLALYLVVLLGVLVAASWSFLRRWAQGRRIARYWEAGHTVLMAVCACLGVWAYTSFGEFHDHGRFGHVNFHSHDFYHYYVGTKYLKEWGYDGMYLATVAALEETGRDDPRTAIRFERIRDLRRSAAFLLRDEFLPLAAAARAKFSPERWTALKADLSFLREKEPSSSWWQDVMLDSGFNPPPSYAVLSSAVSNRIVLGESTWNWLGALDFVLIGVGVGVMCYAFGPVPGLFTLVVLGNVPLRTYQWTGGSFLRHIWVFFLMLGASALARRQWAWAGAALGACTAAVFFPVFFLFGATVPLGCRANTTGQKTPLTVLVVAATAVLGSLVLLSIVEFGVAPWNEWRERIGAHSPTFFANNLGLKKLTTFAPEVVWQAIRAKHSGDPQWNRELVERAQRIEWTDTLLAALLSLWTIAGVMRARPVEACLVVGSGLLVYWTMPSSYYAIYVGVFAAVMLANRSSPWARARSAVVCTALLLSTLTLGHDPMTQSFLLSWGWIATIAILSFLYWLERPAIAHRQREQMLGLISRYR